MALTKAQSIDRIISTYGVVELASRLGIPVEEGTDPAGSEPSVRALLRDMKPRQLLPFLVPALTDEELKELDDVKSNRLVRPHRADWEAAALGEMTEVERERAAVKQAAAVNKAAPSVEQVAKLYIAPIIEPVISPDGDVTMRIRRKFIVGPSGRPKEVPIEEDDG